MAGPTGKDNVESGRARGSQAGVRRHGTRPSFEIRLSRRPHAESWRRVLLIGLGAVIATAIGAQAPAELLDAASRSLASEPEQARAQALEALEASRQTNQTADELRALELLTTVSSALDRRSEAEEFARKRLDLAQGLGSRRSEAQALLALGNLATDATRYGEAEGHLRAAQDLVTELDDPKLTAEVLAELGNAVRQQTRYPEALELYRRSKEISESLEDRGAVGGRWNSIGVVLELMGDFEGALVAHERSLEIHRAVGDEASVATSLYNVAEVHRELGDFETALESFRYALEIDRRVGSRDDVAHSLNQIGLTLLDLGRYSEARESIAAAQRLFEEDQAPRNVSWARSSAGRIALAEGDLDTAERLFDASLQGARESVSLTAGIWRDLADVSLRRGQPDLARRRAEAALDAAIESGEFDKAAEVQALLTRIYETLDEPRRALDAARAELELRQQIFDAQRAGAIASMQSRLETVRREQEQELVEKDRALRTARLERQRLVRDGLIATLVALLVLIFLVSGRVVQRRVNRALKSQVAERTQQLRRKNEELASAYREIEEVSLTDPLTGLRNRRFLERFIADDLARARRQTDGLRTSSAPSGSAGPGVPSEHSGLVFFLIDLDHFKRVNDRHGHAAGDRVLEELAERLTSVFREDDHVVRWGGEEFLAVARSTDRARAPELAERIRSVVARSPFSIDGERTIELTCSTGFSAFPFDLADPEAAGFEAVLAIADTCLLIAKACGRDAWIGVDCPPGGAQLHGEQRVEHAARLAMRSGRWTMRASAPLEHVAPHL